MEPKSKLLLIIIGTISLVFMTMCGSIVETIDANEVLVVQDWWDGELHFYTDAGVHPQWFGHVSIFKKSFQYWFSAKNDQGSDEDQSIKVRFNDGGHGFISGSARIDLPLDDKSLSILYTKFKSQRSIEHEIIRTVIEKSVYMTGPLMSSTQSYSERRTELLMYIEDQALRGVYKTTRRDKKEKDVLTGNEKTVTYVELVSDSNAPGGKAREEKSPLELFNIKMYNISINQITYDERVEEQIKKQQDAIMAVQTAMANAREAEQKTITTTEQGKAAAATAKWEQEAIKAKAVTEGEQLRDVAKLSKEQAEYEKAREILLGEGNARRRQLEMQANGALEQKIEAWIKVNEAYAKAIATYTGNWVPTVVMGNSGSSSSGSDLIDLLKAKTARDLSLDMGMKK